MNKEITWLTPEEAAKYLNVTVITIYRYINDYKPNLPSYKISKSNVRISKEELDSWIKQFKKQNL